MKKFIFVLCVMLFVACGGDGDGKGLSGLGGLNKDELGDNLKLKGKFKAGDGVTLPEYQGQICCSVAEVQQNGNLILGGMCAGYMIEAQQAFLLIKCSP